MGVVAVDEVIENIDEGGKDAKGFQKLGAVCIDSILIWGNYGWTSDLSMLDFVGLFYQLWLDE